MKKQNNANYLGIVASYYTRPVNKAGCQAIQDKITFTCPAQYDCKDQRVTMTCSTKVTKEKPEEIHASQAVDKPR